MSKGHERREVREVREVRERREQARPWTKQACFQAQLAKVRNAFKLLGVLRPCDAIPTL